MSLIPIRWPVSMGRVSTEPEKKAYSLNWIDLQPIRATYMLTFTKSLRMDGKKHFQSTNALIAFLCSSFKINVLSMSSKTDSMAESTHLSSPAAAMFVENKFNPSALW